MNRFVRDQLKRVQFALSKQALRLGVHITPDHYYSPLPNPLKLARCVERWAPPSRMAGIHVDLDEQIRNLAAVCEPYVHEVAGNPHYLYAIKQPFPKGRSRFFGYIEAEVLHAAIRYYKPKHIIEIGSGVPSYCAQQALVRNTNSGCVISIEPDPVPLLEEIARFSERHMPESVRCVFELIAKPIQDVPLDLFTRLNANDIVFIDSDHVVKTGGEVNYVVREILPILPSGVLVQIHDIYLPYDYDRDVLATFLPPNETTVVAAFLAHNSRYKILFALSMLHYERRAEMQRLIPDYRPEQDHYGMRVGAWDANKHFPSSLWLQVTNEMRKRA